MIQIKKIIVVLILFVTNFSEAQIIDSKETIYEINKKVVSFLIQKLELKEGQSMESCIAQITIVEMLKKEPLGYKKNGIYLFGGIHAPNTTFILLKKKSNIKLLDPYYISKTLQQVIKFSERQKCNKKEIIKYVKGVIDVYKMNRYGTIRM